MAIPRNAMLMLLECVLGSGAKRATKYISPREVARATFHGKRLGRMRTRHVVVTVGAPNYEERKFIRVLKKAGERFPVKKIQLKWDRIPI